MRRNLGKKNFRWGNLRKEQDRPYRQIGRRSSARNSSVILRNYLRSYLLMLLIPLCVSLGIYQLAIGVVKQQAIHLQQEAQRNLVSVVDSYIRQIDEMVLQFFFDADITALEQVNSQNMTHRDILLLLRAKKKIGFYQATETLHTHFYLFFPQSQVFLSDTGVTANAKFYYESFLKYEDLSYEQWREQVEKCTQKEVWPSAKITSNESEFQMISYLQPLNSYISTGGSVVLFLFQEERMNQILGAEGEPQVTRYLLDSQNRLIYQTNADGILPEEGILSLMEDFPEEGFLDLGDSLLVYTESERNGWKYVTKIPSKIALGHVETIKHVLLFFLVVTVLVGTGAAYLSSRKAARPIQDLVLLLKEQENGSDSRSGPPNELDYLSNRVSSLLSNGRRMEELMQQQDKVLQSLYIERALSGRIQLDNQELGGISAVKELNSPNLLLNAVLFKLYSLPEDKAILPIETVDVLCSSLLEEREETFFFYRTHVLKQDELVLLFGCSTGDEEFLKNRIQWFAGELFRQWGEPLQFTLGVGVPCRRLQEIRESYLKARSAASYRQAVCPEKGICWWEEVPENTNVFLYSLNTELQLLNRVKNGSVSGVEELLKQIEIDNFENHQLLPAMEKCLIYNLYCTLLKLSDPSGKNTDLEFITITEQNHGDCSHIFQVLRKRFLELAEEYRGKEKGPSDARMGKILEYISQHFQEWGLDTSAIAREFKLSENYFSQYFKEQMGENFSSYLENYRITQSYQLLSNPKLSIQQISESVGYGNVYTFRRAFKRVTGMVPTAYREQL